MTVALVVVLALSVVVDVASSLSTTGGGIQHTLPTCGSGFAVLSAPPAAAVADTASVSPGYRLDFTVRGVSVGSLSTPILPVLDTTFDGVGVTTPLPGSSSLVPINELSGVDYVRVAGSWVRLNVTTIRSQGVPYRLGLAPGGAAGRQSWDDVLVFTHPRGGWIVTHPKVFDPIGVLGRSPDLSQWLRCESSGTPEHGSLCFVPASVGDSPGRVAVVPELQVVWVSPDLMALLVGSGGGDGVTDVVLTVGGVTVSVSLDEYTGSIFRTVRVLDSLAGNDVILGGGVVAAVVHYRVDGAGDGVAGASMRIGVARDSVSRVMGGVDPLDVGLMVCLFFAIVVWGTNTGSRLASSSSSDGGNNNKSTVRSVTIASIAIVVCTLLVAREADDPVTAARMSLWSHCAVDASVGRAMVSSFSVYVLLCCLLCFSLVARLASAYFLAPRGGSGSSIGGSQLSEEHPSSPVLRGLALRTSVVGASTLCMIIAAFRVFGTGFTNRSHIVTMLVMVSCIGIMSRVADCVVLIPWHFSRSAVRSIDHPGVLGSAAFVGLYVLNFLYVALISLTVILPLQTVVLSSFSITPVVHALLTVATVAFLVWLTWRWGSALTGKLPGAVVYNGVPSSL